MGDNFDSRIEAAQKDLEVTFANMEQLREEFIAATVEFMEPWYWDQTETMVTRRPEITKQLGVDKLAQLKADVKSLQENCATIAAEFLADERLWWHQKRGEQAYSYHENRPPGGLDKAVRLIAGKLGPILERYDYLSGKLDRISPLQSHEVWRERDASGSYHPANARPYHPYGFDWSERMRAVLKNYADLLQEGVRQASEIDGLKHAKERSEARDLWEQA